MSRRHYTFSRALRDASKAAVAHARAEERAARLQAKQDVEACLQQATTTNEELSREISDLTSVLEINMRIPYTSVLDESPKLAVLPHDPPKLSKTGPTVLGAIGAWLILSILFSAVPDPGRGVIVFLGVVIVASLIYRMRKSSSDKAVAASLSEVEHRRAEAEERYQAESLEFQNFLADYKSNVQEAIEDYFHASIAQIKLPYEAIYSWNVTYNASSRELIVQYQLPNSSIVPEIVSVKFVKTRHEFDKKLRKPAESGRIYGTLIHSLALTVLRHLFNADKLDRLDIVTLNCFVKTTNKATGKNAEPCLISVRALKKDFEQIELQRVEKAACLKGLGARLTSNAFEMQPIK